MTQQSLFGGEEELQAPRGGVRFSAAELSRLLGHAHPPTAEQARAIEHLDDDGALAPYLIVAGAGSGKTETMAARVVWLVANGLARPERILGLTFTRKAAGELASRVRLRLHQLGASGLLPADRGDDWLAGEPMVSTYHGYAAGLFAEHALRAGREPSARLLSEAATWQYAGRVVTGHPGELADVDWAPSTVIGAVRTLAGDLAEHLRSTDEVRSLTAGLLKAVEALPRRQGQRTRGDRYSETEDFLLALRRRLALLPLVEAYDELKRRTDSLDYGDQVALAARIARAHPVVGQIERGRWDAVLLDEYQDTGTAQRLLLAALFADAHPVTAVGDPCQSIYGWRGASAGNLARFATDFPRRAGGPSARIDLTTSFRNGGRILAVANSLSAGLRRGGVPVRDLVPGPKGPHSGEVVHACLPDADSEAAWTADFVERQLRDVDGRRPRDVAILARARSQFARLELALRERGIPVEVSGLGGLLATPEVADVVATLAVLTSAGSGASLLRLLTGARWRFGPRDLDALARRARRLARPAVPEAAAAVRDARAEAVLLDSADDFSLIEAVEDPGRPDAYSEAAWGRLVALRDEVRRLRSRLGQPLPDLVAEIIRTSRLDVEVAARPGADAVGARAHLDRFLDVAAEFAETEDSASVEAFLAYLDAAAEHERGLDLGRIGTATDSVQLLTMHGAKGLEWPVVIVPGMTRDVFPSRPREGSDWCGNVKLLPFPLRGDSGDLPELGLPACDDQVDVRSALQSHRQACRDRDELEERRLLYVAATRAEDVLLCTGYWWDSTKAARGPSSFLEEVRDACVALGAGVDAGWAPRPADDEPNPLDREPRSAPWPGDPVPPARRRGLDDGAALVRAALTGGEPAADSAAVRGLPEHDAERVRDWDDEVAKLLAERAAAARGAAATIVELPAHLSVSQLVALQRDPVAFARWTRRPVPLPPAPLARRGTAFHAWLEQRFQATRLLDVDELPGSADDGAAHDAELDVLRKRFLASEWADRQPVDGGVEVPFEMSIEGVLIRGRIDAVFSRDDGGWDVIDWKTGHPPTGADAEAAAVQLAAYRLAWHRLTGAPLDRIRAGFHYVRTGETLRPVDLLDEAGLRALIAAVAPADG